MKRGLGRIYRRGNVWWVQYSVHGKRHRESTHSSQRSDAVRLLKQRFGDAAQGKPVGNQVEKTTLGDICAMVEADYVANGRRSLDRAQQSMRHLTDYFSADRRARDITADRITAYTAARLEEKTGPAGINYELAMLRRGFRLALKAGKVATVPAFSMLHVENARKGFFEIEQYQAVMRRLPDHLQPVIAFAYETGWRTQSEVLTRQWRHIDLNAGWARLDSGESKNGHGREFPLTGEVLDLLKAQRERVREIECRTGQIIPWVFVYPNGSQIRSYRHAWAKACRDAGVPGRLVHDLRRTAARAMIRSGIPQTVAMKLTGHETDTVFRRYAIVDAGMLRVAAQKLERFRQNESPRGTVGAHQRRNPWTPGNEDTSQVAEFVGNARGGT